jgi:hypothetical protein
VRGYQVAAVAGAERDLQQVPGVESEDRPAVRGEVTDLRQRRRDPPGGLAVRRVEQMVDLAGPLTLLVDR